MRDFVPEGEDDDWLDHFPLYNPPTIRNALKNLCALRVRPGLDWDEHVKSQARTWILGVHPEHSKAAREVLECFYAGERIVLLWGQMQCGKTTCMALAGHMALGRLESPGLPFKDLGIKHGEAFVGERLLDLAPPLHSPAPP